MWGLGGGVHAWYSWNLITCLLLNPPSLAFLPCLHWEHSSVGNDVLPWLLWLCSVLPFLLLPVYTVSLFFINPSSFVHPLGVGIGQSSNCGHLTTHTRLSVSPTSPRTSNVIYMLITSKDLVLVPNAFLSSRQLFPTTSYQYYEVISKEDYLSEQRWNE